MNNHQDDCGYQYHFSDGEKKDKHLEGEIRRETCCLQGLYKYCHVLHAYVHQNAILPTAYCRKELNNTESRI